MIDIYIVNKNKEIIGTVGYLYYTRHTIKELVSIYCKNGNHLKFYL